MRRTALKGVHVHVFAQDNDEVQGYRDRRDRLRVDGEDRALYAATKRRPAEQQWPDMNDYAEAKTDLIVQILTLARAWRVRQLADSGRPSR